MNASPPRIARSVPLALVVHEASVPYVRPVVTFVRRQLAVHGGGDPVYAECRDVAEARVPPGAVVFVIGDGFPRIERLPGCRYVFVNFSLVHPLRWWRPSAPSALRWMRVKRRALLARAGQFDMVLDFHPRQSRWLARALAPAPVRPFPTAVDDSAARHADTPLASRRWDVCLVGTESPRRARLRERFAALGMAVSPPTAPVLDGVLRDSRVVVNAHFAACDTLEAPRVVHALAAGVCLVTEPCVGLDELAPPQCYVSAPYRRLPSVVAALLRDPERMAAIARAGREHWHGSVAPRARAAWRTLIDDAIGLAA